MNKLPTATQAQILSALCEGNSVRSTCRMTGVAKGTVLRLLNRVGLACAIYHERHVRNIRATKVQADEIWAYCHAKEKNVPKELRGKPGYGDCYTWVALDSDSKLVISWLLGKRSAECARVFMHDLRDRVIGRIHLTTDGLHRYPNAVEIAFHGDVDYAQLIKHYQSVTHESEVRYSPPVCIGTTTKRISGNPGLHNISTSHVERQNLTIRMRMRRFTRLTNAFSKKIENLEMALALHFMHYNFCRVHQTLKTTPAIAAGLGSHVWSVYDLLTMTETMHGTLPNIKD